MSSSFKKKEYAVVTCVLYGGRENGAALTKFKQDVQHYFDLGYVQSGQINSTGASGGSYGGAYFLITRELVKYT